MNIKIVAGIVSLCLFLSGGWLGNIFFLMMINDINRRRQDGSFISYICGSFKMGEILSEYRRLNPGGKLLTYSLVSFAIGIFGMICSGVCFCFFNVR